MRSVFLKLSHSRLAVISFAVIGGLVVLFIVYSVQPTASRFDASAHRPSSAAVGNIAVPGAPVVAIDGVAPFFDFSLVFPEQPSDPIQ